MMIRVCGVPEHFNLPWNLAIEQDLFPKDCMLEWKNEPSGTGAMCKALREGTTDLAVILTEGIVLDMQRGNPSTIISTYVESPLIWGIHTGPHHEQDRIEQFERPIYAVSRIGSGSYWMAKVEAKSRGHSLAEDQFVEIQNFEGAIEQLAQKKADLFLWEKFMSMPAANAGKMRRIGEFPTPWPCFVIAGRNDFLKNHSKQVQSILSIVLDQATKLQFDPNFDRWVSDRFGIPRQSSKEWVEKIEFSRQPSTMDHIEKLMDQVRTHFL